MNRSESITRRRLLAGLSGAAALGALPAGCTPRRGPGGRLRLDYWEKWVRFEGEAMKKVVDAFNRRHPDLLVEYLTGTLGIDRKLTIATAGGDPPDLCGLWDTNVAPFADRAALTPLDELMARDGMGRDHWLEAYAGIVIHRDRVWGVPTTPWTTGLHWNKALFREAGLDPDRPPQTLAELDDYARALTRKGPDGNYTQMGFLPQEPGWFHWAWGLWFGGTLMDGDRITANHPRNVEAFEWIQSYSRRYDVERINRFSSGFGNFASPQNPFFAGRIGMVIQGVWMHNYISQYAPGMQWGVAPWPKTPRGAEDFSTAGADVLVIPAGVSGERLEAAWSFLKYASSVEGMEMLCLGQRKNTPLREVSEGFVRNHPHPYIGLHIEMARGPGATRFPQMGIWAEYQSEIAAAFDRAALLEKHPLTGRELTAQEILDPVQARIERSWERHLASLAMRG